MYAQFDCPPKPPLVHALQLKVPEAFTLMINTWLASGELLNVKLFTLFNSEPVTFKILLPLAKLILICPPGV